MKPSGSTSEKKKKKTFTDTWCHWAASRVSRRPITDDGATDPRRDPEASEIGSWSVRRPRETGGTESSARTYTLLKAAVRLLVKQYLLLTLHLGVPPSQVLVLTPY